MGIAVAAFIVMTATILGGYAAVMHLPAVLATRRLDRRLKDIATPTDDESSGETEAKATVVKHRKEGPLPGVDRAAAGSWLARLIEQSGVNTTSSAMLVISVGVAALLAAVTAIFVRQMFAPFIAAAVGIGMPTLWLMRMRTVRLKRFEEMFPEALDLLSRAIRAGHAFQTAMGMVADELPAPVGPEFRKTFDQQNFGLPLRDALNELTQRIAILDVRFFVTAVLIQRDTGGNLSEILDNLAHVVRERFKIRRQVRVHTAHGRFTGYVLLALPAALAAALTFLNPDLMRLLFEERMGHMLLGGAIGLQIVGYFWIRQVIKIEV
jgi:tight adherence protein B